jgi:hypothetical protein
MVVRAWAQKERRAEYESAAWQPEPELAARPRSVSFATAFKLGGAFGLLAIGVLVALVCLPSLKHAYVTLFGISTQATIQQRSERATGSGWRRRRFYYLVVRFETSSGAQSVRIETSQSYYEQSMHGQGVPVHYLAHSPAQAVLDLDQLYPTRQILVILALGIALLWLQYSTYQKLRTIAESGEPVKGLIVELNQGRRKLYVTVYYEVKQTPYRGSVGIRPSQARRNWRKGMTVTLLAAEPPSSPRRPHIVMTYPDPEFKIISK